MNALHPNDKKGISKHKKMIKRNAAHPIEGMTQCTTSFINTGKVFANEDGTFRFSLKLINCSRNVGWYLARINHAGQTEPKRSLVKSA